MTQENVQKKSKPKLVVIALAVICVILAASLIGVIAFYQPSSSQSQLTEKDTEITSLHAQISALEQQLASSSNESTYIAQIAYLNQQLSAMNDSITSANSDLFTLNSIVNMQVSGYLLDGSNFTQSANSTTVIYNDILEYSGYVVVQATATANTTYAEVAYTVNGFNFDFNRTIGTSGTVALPVVAGTVQIIIGNINQSADNSVTVTADYYY